MKLEYIDAEWHPEEVGVHAAQVYIDRVERKRARDTARAIRRYQRFMDNLWNAALYGSAVFFALAAVAAVASAV